MGFNSDIQYIGYFFYCSHQKMKNYLKVNLGLSRMHQNVFVSFYFSPRVIFQFSAIFRRNMCLKPTPLIDFQDFSWFDPVFNCSPHLKLFDIGIGKTVYVFIQFTCLGRFFFAKPPTLLAICTFGYVCIELHKFVFQTGKKSTSAMIPSNSSSVKSSSISKRMP